MSAPYELAPPIGTQPATSSAVHVPDQSTSLPIPTRHSSDEDQTAVPTPADSQSVRESTEAPATSEKPSAARAKSNSDKGNAAGEGKDKDGWTYDQQLKVSDTSDWLADL
jgi:hypothetical protein